MPRRLLVGIIVLAVLTGAVVARLAAREGDGPVVAAPLDALEEPLSLPSAATDDDEPDLTAGPDSEPAAAEVEPTPTPTPTPTPVKTADPQVMAVQQRLTDLRYYVSSVDGFAGPATSSAVMAFQKVNGLQVDGSIGPQTLAALDAPATPSLLGTAPDRIEVDLGKQVLFLVRGGALERIVPVSSGNGAIYETAKGNEASALTPIGNFRVQRHIKGERKADLGILYDPKYFFKGWAIHGSNSVPATEASHGCVRVTRADMLWLFDRMPVGMPVSLYGGRHVFVVGQTDPGTDDPGGDTGAAAQPEVTDPAADPNAEPTPAPSPSAEGSPSPTPSPDPSASPSPSPTPSPDPSASPSPSPTPSPDPSPSPSPSSGEASPSASPSPTPSPSPA